MKKLIVGILSILISTQVFAMGGARSGHMYSPRSIDGVDSFSFYFGGKGQVDIRFSCDDPNATPNRMGVCECNDGYKSEKNEKGDTVCVVDRCYGINTYNGCIQCTSENGVIKYAYPTLCNNNKGKCNPATRECELVCTPIVYDDRCQTCEVDANGNPDIKNKSGTCGTGKNWICESGVCVNPCDYESERTCKTCQPVNGVATFVNDNTKTCGSGWACSDGQCVNPCDKAIYSADCQICTPTNGKAIITPKPTTTTCGEGGNYRCDGNGTCNDPCKGKMMPVCQECYVEGGVAKTRMLSDKTCGTNKVCNVGSCVCESNYNIAATDLDTTIFTYESCADDNGTHYKKVGCVNNKKTLTNDGNCACGMNGEAFAGNLNNGVLEGCPTGSDWNDEICACVCDGEAYPLTQKPDGTKYRYSTCTDDRGEHYSILDCQSEHHWEGNVCVAGDCTTKDDCSDGYACVNHWCTDPCAVGEYANFEATTCAPHHVENGECKVDYEPKGSHPNCDGEHADYVCNGQGKCTCPEGQFRGNKGSCITCSTSFGYATTAEKCAECDNTNNPRIMWTYKDVPYCVLATCPKGQFRRVDGYCLDCNITIPCETTQSDCDACKETNTPRMMWAYENTQYCVWATCPHELFHKLDGQCEGCLNTSPLQATNDACAECDNTDNPRFMGSDDKCYPCAYSDGVATTAEACTKCPNIRTYNTETGMCELCPEGGCPTTPTCSTDNLSACDETACNNLEGYTWNGTACVVYSGDCSSSLNCSNGQYCSFAGVTTTGTSFTTANGCAAKPVGECKVESAFQDENGVWREMENATYNYMKSESLITANGITYQVNPVGTNYWNNVSWCEAQGKVLITSAQFAQIKSSLPKSSTGDGPNYAEAEFWTTDKWIKWDDHAEIYEEYPISDLYVNPQDGVYICLTSRASIGICVDSDCRTDNLIACDNAQCTALGNDYIYDSEKGCRYGVCSKTNLISCDETQCVALGTGYSYHEQNGCIYQNPNCGWDNFRGLDGNCYDCTEVESIEATQEACAACTFNTRAMIGNYCMLPCEEGSFATMNGRCASCSEEYLSDTTEQECLKCNGTRKMYGDSCGLVSCPAGRFHNIYGGCNDCSFNMDIESTAEYCSVCDNFTRREIIEHGGVSYCIRKPCSTDNLSVCTKTACEDLGADYSYSDTDGCIYTDPASKICSTDNLLACDTVEKCTELGVGYTWTGWSCIRSASDGESLTCVAGSTFLANDYMDDEAESMTKQCISCQDKDSWNVDSEADCLSCGSNVRKVFAWCSLYSRCIEDDCTVYTMENCPAEHRNHSCGPASCSSNEFQGIAGDCIPCDSPYAEFVADASECQKCGNLREVVINEYIGKQCQLKQCPSDTMRISGSCFSCNEEEDVVSTKEECATCGGKRHYEAINDSIGRCCPESGCRQTQSVSTCSTDNLSACDATTCTGLGVGYKWTGTECVSTVLPVYTNNVACINSSDCNSGEYCMYYNSTTTNVSIDGPESFGCEVDKLSGYGNGQCMSIFRSISYTDYSEYRQLWPTILYALDDVVHTEFAQATDCCEEELDCIPADPQACQTEWENGDKELYEFTVNNTAYIQSYVGGSYESMKNWCEAIGKTMITNADFEAIKAYASTTTDANMFAFALKAKGDFKIYTQEGLYYGPDLNYTSRNGKQYTLTYDEGTTTQCSAWHGLTFCK